MGEYKGREVNSPKIKVPGYALTPIGETELAQGEEYYVLYKCRCGEDRYKPVETNGEDTGVNDLIQTLKPLQAMIVAESVGKEQFEGERERIRAEIERLAGTPHLRGIIPGADNDMEDEAFLLVEAHRAGQHDEGLVSGCEMCDMETDFEEKEAEGA